VTAFSGYRSACLTFSGDRSSKRNIRFWSLEISSPASRQCESFLGHYRATTGWKLVNFALTSTSPAHFMTTRISFLDVTLCMIMTTTSASFVTASVVSWTPVKGNRVNGNLIFANPYVHPAHSHVRGRVYTRARSCFPSAYTFSVGLYHTETKDPRDLFRIAVQQPKKTVIN